MCFSATASFTASAILAIIGLLSVRKAHLNEIPFALIPTFFSLQQACEGILWLTYGSPGYTLLSVGALYGFSFFAFIFWPFWIPMSILMMEEDQHRMQLLRLLLILGSAIATFLFFSISKTGIEATVACHHIRYELFLPTIVGTIGTVLYCIATIFSCMVSSRPWVPFFGLLVAGSVTITYLFYTGFFASVWCFFAALLSMMILTIV